MHPPPEPPHVSSLTYVCQCREEWRTHQPLEQPVLHSPLPCPPECWMCAADGPCEVRRNLPPVYERVDFAEIKPVRRKYQRMKATA